MTNRAIVIGIDKYWTELESLKGAVADAIDFASWLVEANEVDPANLHLGLCPTEDSEKVPPGLKACPSVGTSLHDLTQFFTDLRDQQPDSGRIYFFFSGHGAASNNPHYPEEAICLKDFTDRAHNEALEISALLTMLKSFPATERFIFLDGCRNTVFEDSIEFGHLGSRPRAAPGIQRTFVLRATGPGRAAAEISRRGLFSTHLCRGLRGGGSAKRWDSTGNAGNGAYNVRWGALTQFVAAEVGKLAEAQQLGQLVYLGGGEAPAGDDPQFAQYPADKFQPASVKIRLKLPDPPPRGAKIVARRNESWDPEVSFSLADGNPAAFTLIPSLWSIRALADGYRSVPGLKPVPVYDDSVEEEIELAPADQQQQQPQQQQQQQEQQQSRRRRPERPRRGPDRDSLVLFGGSEPPGATSFAGIEPYGTTSLERITGFPDSSGKPRAPATDPQGQPDAKGWLRLAVAGRAPSAIHPPLRISIARDSGEIVSDNPSDSPVALAPGAYRVRIIASDGMSEELYGSVEAGEITDVDLSLPGAASPAMDRALASVGKQPSSAGFAMPSEMVGEIAEASLVTVATLATAQAVQARPGALAGLGLGQRWRGSKARGVTIIIVDERAAGADGAPPVTPMPRAHLWTMFKTNEGAHARLRAPPGQPSLSAADLVAADGGYWLELEDANRARRSGFKLATLVLPDHVTLVVRHQLPAGQLDIFQFAIPRAPGETRDILDGLVHAEAVQRARARGFDPSADPAVAGLVAGRWFEPVSAILIAAALLDREAPGADLDALIGALDRRRIETADVLVLRAVRADRAGDAEAARTHFRAALARREAPLIDSLLDHLNDGAQRHRLRGGGQAWVAEKTRQALGHPLWTLRREDDRRPDALPDGLAAPPPARAARAATPGA